MRRKVALHSPLSGTSIQLAALSRMRSRRTTLCLVTLLLLTIAVIFLDFFVSSKATRNVRTGRVLQDTIGVANLTTASLLTKVWEDERARKEEEQMIEQEIGDDDYSDDD